MCSIVSTYAPYVEVCERLNACVPGDFAKNHLAQQRRRGGGDGGQVARAYTGRHALIVFEGAYHGRTNLTLGMTSKYALVQERLWPVPPKSIACRSQSLPPPCRHE